MTRVILFDGESGLRSATAQKTILEKFKIVLRADAYWKRPLAERYIREVKLRVAIALENRG